MCIIYLFLLWWDNENRIILRQKYHVISGKHPSCKRFTMFDNYSSGCNKLIFSNCASLLTNAEDFCLAMGWTDDVRHQKQLSEGIQQELFAGDFTADEQRVLQALAKDDSKQMNVLTVETNIPVGELSSLLFSLEMKGAVRALVGNKYKLVR